MIKNNDKYAQSPYLGVCLRFFKNLAEKFRLSAKIGVDIAAVSGHAIRPRKNKRYFSSFVVFRVLEEMIKFSIPRATCRALDSTDFDGVPPMCAKYYVRSAADLNKSAHVRGIDLGQSIESLGTIPPLLEFGR